MMVLVWSDFGYLGKVHTKAALVWETSMCVVVPPPPSPPAGNKMGENHQISRLRSFGEPQTHSDLQKDPNACANPSSPSPSCHWDSSKPPPIAALPSCWDNPEDVALCRAHPRPLGHLQYWDITQTLLTATQHRQEGRAGGWRGWHCCDPPPWGYKGRGGKPTEHWGRAESRRGFGFCFLLQGAKGSRQKTNKGKRGEGRDRKQRGRTAERKKIKSNHKNKK